MNYQYSIVKTCWTAISNNLSVIKKPIGLAIFGLTGTLITTQTGRIFPSDEDDFVFYPNVIDTLKQLQANGWVIAILANDKGNGNGLVPVIDKRNRRVLETLEKSEINCVTVISMIDDKFRKGELNIISVLLHLLKIESSDVKQVFVCGSEIGSTDQYPPYRLSDIDTRLSNELKCKLYRPIDLFSQVKPKPLPEHTVDHPYNQEVIILMGIPGCGKSTFAANFVTQATKYIICNQDQLKSKKRVLDKMDTALKEGFSVIIDATNPGSKKRLEYIDIGRKYEAKIRIIWFVRDGRPFNRLRDKPVPEIAYNMYAKEFVAPDCDPVDLIEIV